MMREIQFVAPLIEIIEISLYSALNNCARELSLLKTIITSELFKSL